MEATESTVGQELFDAPPMHGFFTRLYTGTVHSTIIGRRKLWFPVSALIVAVAIASILISGFNSASTVVGSKVSLPRRDITVEQVEEVYRHALGYAPERW